MLLTAQDVVWSLSLAPGGFGALADVMAEVEAGLLARPVRGGRWLVEDLHDYADKLACERLEESRKKAFAANANPRPEAACDQSVASALESPDGVAFKELVADVMSKMDLVDPGIAAIGVGKRAAEMLRAYSTADALVAELDVVAQVLGGEASALVSRVSTRPADKEWLERFLASVKACGA